MRHRRPHAQVIGMEPSAPPTEGVAASGPVVPGRECMQGGDGGSRPGEARPPVDAADLLSPAELDRYAWQDRKSVV